MRREHPSMVHAAAACSRREGFRIINVTKEVIRDYFEETAADELDKGARPRTSGNVNHTPIFQAVATAQNLPGHEAETNILHRDGAVETPSFPGPEPFLSPQNSDSAFEDGIFLPGSQYQELHATLRSRLIDTARSTAPSRIGSPEIPDVRPSLHRSDSAESDDEESRRLAQLSAEQEYALWQNYIDEVAPWMDKFDNERHFELVLPVISKTHPHVRYSILALSARQLELKAQRADNQLSLALYQHAIHLLSPLLQQRTTVVLASCVVLCVLEMMSCSPKAWRRHLDGCAALIQSLGLTGECGGLEQAMFWCFARMDICGGLISSERTLIPMHRWLSSSGDDFLTDYSLLQNISGFDTYANRVVYLCGQVIDLLCSSGKWEQRHHHQQSRVVMDATEYIHHWTHLFEVLEKWYLDRPEEMKPLLTIPTTQPFQTLFYGNGSAVSGNQMYHTAALLMLKYKPSHLQFQASVSKKPHSILWHARQICAISLSNRHHAAWTNSVQPLWVAGQHMSHECEHRAILEIYGVIEKETGWKTRWRADDLREYWGEGEEEIV
ncbi:C6 transcription factor [Lecanosticta acicola]|uniref:C6 transcription factor n=1 Tax=Lecanosticta acicola TaxID=111012 RepID=A0AAI8Z5T7_9PEZI|nr:C6 transcription factor [Lecanosticta acicola]